MSHWIWVRIGYALLAIAAAGLVALFTILTFGSVSGVEFAPDTFQRRTYRYYEIPLIHLKVSPLKRYVNQTQFEQFLVNGNYITTKSTPQRWDLVSASRTGGTWRVGDAKILCQYLDAWDLEANTVSYWESWTKDHSSLGKVLWPEVAQLARQELYFLIPPLFDMALAADKPPVLHNDLNAWLARSYERLAEVEVELHNLDAAVRFYDDALSREPGRTSSLEGRARCRRALGRGEAASGDQAPATQAEAPL